MRKPDKHNKTSAGMFEDVVLAVVNGDLKLLLTAHETCRFVVEVL